MTCSVTPDTPPYNTLPRLIFTLIPSANGAKSWTGHREGEHVAVDSLHLCAQYQPAFSLEFARLALKVGPPSCPILARICRRFAAPRGGSEPGKSGHWTVLLLPADL